MAEGMKEFLYLWVFAYVILKKEQEGKILDGLLWSRFLVLPSIIHYLPSFTQFYFLPASDISNNKQTWTLLESLCFKD